MRATVMFGAGDVRIDNIPDASLIEPTDALVTVTRACICGKELVPTTPRVLRRPLFTELPRRGVFSETQRGPGAQPWPS